MAKHMMRAAALIVSAAIAAGLTDADLYIISVAL